MKRSSSAIAGKYVAVLAAAGILYAISCAPGAVWQDSGLIQYRVWHNDIEGNLGLALSHPLYYILAIGAKVIPLGEFGHRVNLLSALAGAVAIANLYLLVRLWLGRDVPALIAAVTLAVSHTFWRHASIAETYTLWTAIFLGELIMLLQYTKGKNVRYLYLLGLLNGMAIAVHMLASIPLACYAVFVAVLLAKKTVRPKQALCIVLLWMLGALPYGYLIAKTMIQSGDVLGTLASAAFGVRWRGDVLNTSVSWRLVKENVLFMALNFPTPNILLALAGFYALCKRESASAFPHIIFVLLVLFSAFAFRYTISDRYAFFIPLYAIISIFIGPGVHLVQTRVHRKVVLVLIGAFSLLPAAAYAIAPGLAQRMEFPMETRGDIPYRNDYQYFLQPWKTGDTGARRFATEALQAVEDNAVIVADTTTVAPLLYVQEVEGVQPEVKVVTGIASSKDAPPYDAQTLMELVVRRPVYVTSKRMGYCPRFILEDYDLVKVGVLWKVAPSSKPD